MFATFSIRTVWRTRVLFILMSFPSTLTNAFSNEIFLPSFNKIYPVRSPDGCILLTDIDEHAIIDKTSTRITRVLNFFIKNPSRSLLEFTLCKKSLKKYINFLKNCKKIPLLWGMRRIL